jgi:N-acetylmuramoyl-L-alanine amidase
MEKTITKILIAIIFCSSILFAKGLSEQITEINSKIPFASQHEKATILNQLENLYIRAVISANQKNIINTLQGIIKCQKSLGLDTSTYEKELYSIIPKEQLQKPIKLEPATVQVQNRIPNVTTTPYQQEEVPSNIHNALSIQSIKMQENTIIMKFDRDIKIEDIKFFKIEKKNLFKNVYDLRANLRTRKPSITTNNLDRVKIAQNRPDKVRIVLQNNTKVYSKSFIRKGTLFIKINNQKKIKKAPTPAPIIVKKPDPIMVPPIKIIKPKVVKPKIVKKEPVKKPIIKKKTKPKYKPLPIPSKSSDSVYASNKIIVIDAGHGGKDSGAVGYKKYKEKKCVLKIAKLTKDILEQDGYKVYMTRDSDKFVKLGKRTHFANKKNADLFISIHANAAPKNQYVSLRGIETFFLSPAKTAKAKRIAAKENSAAIVKLSNKSKDTLLSFLNRNKIIQSNKLAIDVQSSILTKVREKYSRVKDGGVREAPFWVLVGAQMPAVLLEVGYITNPLEADRLFNPSYQRALAQGIVNGINNYFVRN